MEPILISAAALIVLIFVLIAMFAKFYRKIEQGHALIVNTMRAEPTVTFTGCMVYPVIHKAELMEISVKTIEIDRSGREGLICKDNIRADIKVKFFVRVNKTAEDVLKVAQGLGCERASNQDALEDLFSAKFSEALKTVGKSMEFVDLYQARDHFRDEIIRQIGDDLSGYVLEDAAIDYLEQTPLAKLDGSNILDAQGIKKITELTAVESVRTNELRRCARAKSPKPPRCRPRNAPNPKWHACKVNNWWLCKTKTRSARKKSPKTTASVRWRSRKKKSPGRASWKLSIANAK